MPPQRVIFAHLAGHQNTGAKIMRCDQLAAMAKTHLDPRRWSFEVMAMPRKSQPGRQYVMTDDVRGAVVIFLKRAWKVLAPEHMENWRAAAHRIAVDYVDAEVTPQPRIPVDAHIAASGALERYLKRAHPNATVLRLNHHADPMITPHTAADGLHLAYFGRHKNRTLPESLRHRVHTPDYDGLKMDAGVQSAMARANMHYAVRDMADESARTSFKPFTKGFNAAAAGANVLVNAQVDDAVDWLGQDYPFLVPDCAPDTVSNAIDKAASMVGTKDWTDALSTMAHLRERVSPRQITSQLETILQTICD